MITFLMKAWSSAGPGARAICLRWDCPMCQTFGLSIHLPLYLIITHPRSTPFPRTTTPTNSLLNPTQMNPPLLVTCPLPSSRVPPLAPGQGQPLSHNSSTVSTHSISIHVSTRSANIIGGAPNSHSNTEIALPVPLALHPYGHMTVNPLVIQRDGECDGQGGITDRWLAALRSGPLDRRCFFCEGDELGLWATRPPFLEYRESAETIRVTGAAQEANPFSPPYPKTTSLSWRPHTFVMGPDSQAGPTDPSLETRAVGEVSPFPHYHHEGKFSLISHNSQLRSAPLGDGVDPQVTSQT